MARDYISVKVDLKNLEGKGKRAEHMRPALERFGGYMLHQTAQRFATETGPDNKSWKKSKRALKQGGLTLQDEGRLAGSINIMEIDQRSVIIGTDIHYGKYHNSDAPRTIMPKRKFLGFNDDDIEYFKQLILKRLQE